MKIKINLNKNIFPMTDLEKGAFAFVHEYRSPSPNSGRLQELGLISGTIFQVKRRAVPLHPLEISLRDYTLLISKEDAAEILVSRIA